MSNTPYWQSSQGPDFNSRDYDRPSNPTPHDPIDEAFGYEFRGDAKQLEGVFDERNGLIDARNGKHFFWRCYATKPCRVLVDYYSAQPNPIEFGGYKVDEAISNMRAAATVKAAKIAKQLEAYNATHPEARYGLVSVIGADTVTKADVERAAEGEILSARTELQSQGSRINLKN